MDSLLRIQTKLQTQVHLRHLENTKFKQNVGARIGAALDATRPNLLQPSMAPQALSHQVLKGYQFVRKRKRDQVSAFERANEFEQEEAIEWEDLKKETVHERKVRYARLAVRQLHVCLDILADSGITITTEQNIMIKAIWSSVLPQLCGDQLVYQQLKYEFKKNYGLEWVSKGNNCFAGRRTGKSYAFSLAMACLAASGLKLRLVFVNLFSAAGNTNLTYMKQFLDKLRNDPLKRIRIGEIKQVDNYYLNVESHMQILAREEQQKYPNMMGIDIPTHNMLASLPNMDSGGGNVRSFFLFLFFVFEIWQPTNPT